MHLTIDSDQQLDDVLRVVGAMFNVTLQVQPAAPDEAGSASAARPGRARSGSGGRRARAGRARRESTADIRTWAAANGHEVASRGRIPTSVVSAYRAAHRS